MDSIDPHASEGRCLHSGPRRSAYALMKLAVKCCGRHVKGWPKGILDWLVKPDGARFCVSEYSNEHVSGYKGTQQPVVAPKGVCCHRGKYVGALFIVSDKQPR